MIDGFLWHFKSYATSLLSTWPTWLGILLKWASTLTKLARDVDCRLAWFPAIRNFLANEIFLFRGYPTKQAAFLPGQYAPYNQPCSQSLFLASECYFAENVEVRFLKFQGLFSQNAHFSLVATFFSLVLIISSSWYMHLNEFLTFISFNSWSLKGKSKVFTSGTSYPTLWKPNALSKYLKGH